MKIKSRKKRSVVRTPKNADEKHLGTEPSWEVGQEATVDELRAAYNWYNYFHSYKDRIKLLHKNYPRDKRELTSLKKIKESEIPGSICYLARMQSLGCKLPKSSRDHFNNTIDGLLNRAKSEKKVQQAKKNIPVITIQDRIKEKTNEYLAELEYKLDEFLDNKCKIDFNMYEWLEKHQLKSQHAQAIFAFYSPILKEVQEAQQGKDQELVENYSYLKKTEMKRYIEFLSNIVTDAKKWSTNQKTVRKARKKKTISVSKQTSKVKYLSESTEYKVVSVNPADIIGASQLWVFNVKYRLMTRYNAMGPAGFSIKGTTLQGFDPDNSVTKKIRKPQDFLNRVLTGGKIVLRKLMDEVKTTASSPTGRINSDTILLKVVK
jgi:hypothetical protein